jgi:hypothetical protein
VARNKLGDRVQYWLRRPAYLARWSRFRHLTMVKRRSYADNLYLADHAVRAAGLADGSVIECGTWAGGMSFGLMSTLRQIKEFHFFDSFEGLPPATEEDGERALKARELGILKHDGNTAAYEPFAANAERFRAPDQEVSVHRGWFQDTLPGFQPKRPIAVLRLDGDWYESTFVALTHLYDQVAHGGIILIDDYYHWDGCSRAIHDFLSSRKGLERIGESRHGVAYMIRHTHPPKGAD